MRGTGLVPYSFVLDIVLDAMQRSLEIVGYSPLESLLLIKLFRLRIMAISKSFVHGDERQIAPEDHALLLAVLSVLELLFNDVKVHGVRDACLLRLPPIYTGPVRLHLQQVAAVLEHVRSFHSKLGVAEKSENRFWFRI